MSEERITYEPTGPESDAPIVVKLNGKTVGRIHCASDDRWQYTMAGSGHSGDVFPTLEACKASLEGDDE